MMVDGSSEIGRPPEANEATRVEVLMIGVGGLSDSVERRPVAEGEVGGEEDDEEE